MGDNVGLRRGSESRNQKAVWSEDVTNAEEKLHPLIVQLQRQKPETIFEFKPLEDDELLEHDETEKKTDYSGPALRYWSSATSSKDNYLQSGLAHLISTQAQKSS